MSSNLKYLIERAETVCTSSVGSTQNLNYIKQLYETKDLVSSINYLIHDFVKEIKILQIYLISLLYSSSNATIDQARCIANWLAWVKKQYQEYITNKIFDEMEESFRKGLLSKLRESRNILDFVNILETSKIIIEAGANKHNYLNEFEMKITILGWDLIGEVIAGNFNILKITQEVSVISAAQEFKINCDCFSETILTAILDDLEDNFRGKNPIELYSLLDKLGKIKIKDENLKKKFMNQKEICNEWIAKSIKIDASLINADTVY